MGILELSLPKEQQVGLTVAGAKGSRELSRGQTYTGFLRGGVCQDGDFQGGDW